MPRTARAVLTAALATAVLSTLPALPARAAAVDFGGGCSLPAAPAHEEALAGVAPHPRIVLGATELATARSIDAAGTADTRSLEARRSRQQLRHADTALTAALPAREDSLSLVGRAATERILRLSYAMAANEDGRDAAGDTARDAADYSERIRQEVRALVGFSDWGSTAPLRYGEDSLLVTADLALPVALGYSVVRDRMTGAERAATLAALTTKALRPACAAWATGFGQVRETANWGVVVNASMALAALAVTDTDRPLAAAALGQALPLAATAVKTTNRDGGSPEGPGYAGLANSHSAFLAASMRAALGPAGLAQVALPGGAARYAALLEGPSQSVFAYADGDRAAVLPLLPIWQAQAGGDPLGARIAQQWLAREHASTLLLLWGTQGAARAASAPAAPLGQTFAVSGVAAMRTGWDSSAAWVGVKGGSNAAPHAHLDLGGFVYDVGGTRFVDDYGKDSYSLPSYAYAPQRWSYYRVSTQGHSTLQRRKTNQPPTASAPMSTVTTSGGTSSVLVNTTAALQARWAQRAVSLAPGGALTVTDQVRMGAPAALRWWAHTEAGVRVSSSGRTANLTRDGRTVQISLPAGTPGVLRAAAAPPAPAGGYSNAGWTRLYLDAGTSPSTTRAGEHQLTLKVVLTPR